MASVKDIKFNMVMSTEEKDMLARLAGMDDVSEAQVIRTLIREKHAQRVPGKRRKNV